MLTWELSRIDKLYSGKSGIIDMEDRLDSFVQLLSMPEPPEMPPRRHHLTQEGDPAKQRDLLQFQPMYYAQYVMQERARLYDASW